MSQQDLDNILTFAEENHLLHTPFIDVFNKWDNSNKEYLQQQEADNWLSTMEAHELNAL